MKTGKGSEGILRQGLIVISLVMLFFTISAAGFGIETIQAEKAFSEYSGDIYISNDFKKLLVIDTDDDSDEEDVSYWDIEGKENPVLIWEKRRKLNSRAERAYSPDLRYYADIKENTIYVKKNKNDNLLNKIKLPSKFIEDSWDIDVKISNDNSKLAVTIDKGIRTTEMIYFYLYDIKSGNKIGDIELPAESFSLPVFSPDDKYFAFNYRDSSGAHERVYSIEKEAIIFMDESLYGENDIKFYTFVGRDMLAIRHQIKKVSDFEVFIEIIDISKGLYGEVVKTFESSYFAPMMRIDFLGSMSLYKGTTRSGFNELIAVGDKLEKYRTHQIEDEEIKKIAYNKGKKEWVIVGQNKVHYIPTDAAEAKESFKQYAEALELLEIGFEEGVDRVKEILVEAPSTALAQNNGRFLMEYDLTLKQRAELVLAEYNCLLAGGMLDNYDLLYAHRKLFEYGLLAARAGYPQLTLQAAEQIRNLELIYPNDLFWDLINKESILLEALGIAVRDGSEAGYSYMMDNDGIIYDDEDRNYLLDSYFNDYPEYFAPLLADRKKMSYFTKIAENKIPSVHMWQPEKVDFVDLEGNEIAGVEGHTGDSAADGAAGDNSSSESDDLNSEDSNSSDSAGTVLD